MAGLGSRRKTGDPDQVFGASPTPHLLTATLQLRSQVIPLRDHKNADTLRSSQLVRRGKHHLDTRPRIGKRHLAKPLGHIRHSQPLRQGLQNARFRIRELNSRHLWVRDRNRALRINGQIRGQPGQDRLMFDLGARQPATSAGKRRSFGGTRHKYDIGIACAHRLGNVLTRLFHQPFGRTPFAMNRRRVPDDIHCRYHRRPSRITQRRCRIMIQVDPHP